MGRLLALASLLALGCGRVAFETSTSWDATTPDGTGNGDAAIDARHEKSCDGLPASCGPAGLASCCDSPIVPGGSFFRGYDAALDGAYSDMTSPATVSTFRLDRYEVTVGRFRQFVADGMGTQQNPPAAGAGARSLNGLTNQAGWDPFWSSNLAADSIQLHAGLNCQAAYQTWTDAPGANENRPIVCISWYEAMAFCTWDGGFLPTETEWNYAASGGSEQRAYAWSNPPGDTTSDCTVANYGASNWPTTACTAAGARDVGSSSPAGDGRWGQSDLGGNAAEWVLDWYASPYPSPCQDCATVGSASFREQRGGDYGDPPSYMRASGRLTYPASPRSIFASVRCARTP